MELLRFIVDGETQCLVGYLHLQFPLIVPSLSGTGAETKYTPYIVFPHGVELDSGLYAVPGLSVHSDKKAVLYGSVEFYNLDIHGAPVLVGTGILCNVYCYDNVNTNINLTACGDVLLTYVFTGLATRLRYKLQQTLPGTSVWGGDPVGRLLRKLS